MRIQGLSLNAHSSSLTPNVPAPLPTSPAGGGGVRSDERGVSSETSGLSLNAHSSSLTPRFALSPRSYPLTPNGPAGGGGHKGSLKHSLLFPNSIPPSLLAGRAGVGVRPRTQGRNEQ